MSLVVADNLKLAYGTRELLKGASFTIGPKDRVGLIGPNGTGKTTILRVLTGSQTVDDGHLRIQRGIRMGYLPQEITDIPDKGLLTYVLESVPGKRDLEGEIADAERDLEASTDPDEQMELATRLSELHEAADHQETFFSQHEAERILVGLGFAMTEFDRPLTELSGGWRMRAALAALLFQKPDVLLLDEPTNHLDATSVHWLESFLAAFPHAMVLICHDREFLDRQVERVLSLEPEGLRAYSGNYSRYLKLREEEVRVIDAQAENQERKRKELERFIAKYRANKPKARQAQSRIKLLRKMDEIDKLDKPQEIKRFSFPSVERTVRDVAILREISKSFGSLSLYRDLSLTIHRGDRIAIIGVNGSGKTTLLRILAGELSADSGEVKLGSDVRMGYYAQHQSEQLLMESTVLDEVWRVVPTSSQSFVRGVCGAFLFPGEDVDKKIAMLSGGEKARVSLARLLVKPYNFLVMDEPTNHLDLSSAEALAEALEAYNGTLAFVSHNQAFVNRLATKVWNLESGRIEEFPGNLADYYYHLDRVAEIEAGKTKGAAKTAGAQTKKAAPKPTPTPAPKTKAKPTAPAASPSPSKAERMERRRVDAELRKEYNRRLSAAKKKVRELESRIARIEDRQAEAGRLLADPDVYSDGERMTKLLKEFDENKKKLDELMPRWEFATAELEAVEAEDPFDG